MLVDATNGLVRVMNIKRTKLPIIGGQEDETQQESTYLIAPRSDVHPVSCGAI
jgi:hypothetical protein